MQAISLFNATGFKNIIGLGITGDYSAGLILPCSAAKSHNFTFSQDLTMYGISSDGKYIGKTVYPATNSSDFAVLTVYFTLNGQTLDCNGNPVDLNINTSDPSFPYFYVDLKPISETAIGKKVTLNGDGSVTIDDNVYMIEKLNNTSSNNNSSLFLYIIIIFLVIVAIVAIVYIIANI